MITYNLRLQEIVEVLQFGLFDRLFRLNGPFESVVQSVLGWVGAGQWSGGAMGLGKLPGPGRPINLDNRWQGPTALAAGAGWVVWTFFYSSVYSLFFSPTLREMARYRRQYCLKGPLNQKQPTNQSVLLDRLPQRG